MLNKIRNSVRTSQITHYFSNAKNNRLILFTKIMVLLCKNNREHKNTVYGQNAEFQHFISDVACSKHWEFKGYSRDLLYQY